MPMIPAESCPVRRDRRSGRVAASLCALALALAPALVARAQSVTQPPLTPPLTSAGTVPDGEIRAMWIVRDSITTPAKVRNVVALAKKYGFNTLFVQVRGRGDAYYDSRFEPRAEDLANQPSDFDPLQMTIDEGHRAGLEVHAWMNTFLVWSSARKPYSASHVVNQHPEWLVRDKSNRARTTPNSSCEGAFLDPALPGVQKHTKNVFLDVATRYAVDGIHFDYVRYPCEDYSYSDAALNAFRSHMARELPDNDVAYADAKLRGNRLAYYYLYKSEWKAWRQAQVTDAVREIALTARQFRPELIVSAAVFPNYSVALFDKGQPWRDWLRDGLLDAVCPMTYNKNTEVVGAQVREALANSYGRPVVPGVGAWQMPAASAIAKALLCRQLGASGLNFFSYDGMTRNGRTEAYLNKVALAVFSTPTTPPNWRRPVEVAARPATVGVGAGVGPADAETTGENVLQLRLQR
jgi:uncharacterized lipoprotein YddW (UPF0748 family)